MNVFKPKKLTKTPRVRKKSGASLASLALKRSAQFWFVTTVLGQWLFAYYVALAYGRVAVQGDFEKWNEISPHAYVPGEPMGNVTFGLHMLFALIILGGGPLQFIPQVRVRFPKFHRWNGRVYLLTVFLTALDGVYLTLTRGAAGSTSGVLLDAVLVMAFTLPTLRYAMVGKIQIHQRWAFRLFMVASGVWFFRVMIFFWLFVHGRAVGFDPETFEGPFITFTSFANYLLPLAILELYFFTKKRAGTFGHFAMAFTVVAFTLMMALGIFAVTMGAWLPYL